MSINSWNLIVVYVYCFLCISNVVLNLLIYYIYTNKAPDKLFLPRVVLPAILLPTQKILLTGAFLKIFYLLLHLRFQLHLLPSPCVTPWMTNFNFPFNSTWFQNFLLSPPFLLRPSVSHFLLSPPFLLCLYLFLPLPQLLLFSSLVSPLDPAAGMYLSHSFFFSSTHMLKILIDFLRRCTDIFYGRGSKNKQFILGRFHFVRFIVGMDLFFISEKICDFSFFPGNSSFLEE